MTLSIAFLAGTALLTAAPLLRGGGPLSWRVGIAGGVALCCAAAATLPVDALTSPLVAQLSGQAPLVVARALLVAAALLLVRLIPRRERNRYAVAAASTLVLSWMAQAGLLALAASYVAIAMRARRWVGRARRGDIVSLVAICALAAVWLALRPPAPAPPSTDRELALRWEARENPWRALPPARAWAAQEPSSLEAAALLERLSRRLAPRSEPR